MSPMTRNRANNNSEAPTELHQEYYSQRAGAGLILSEGSPVSRAARGYMWTAGIFNQDQIDGWKKVNAKVHDDGGIIYCQIWHVGRVSHSYFQDGVKPLAPSALNANSKAFTPNGFEDTSDPREMTKDDINEVVEQFRKGAANAIEAGFDGVQIHGANGYLIEQFLHDSANKRDDEYGGSIENRARFLFEIIEAVTDEIGADRTSLRLSPSGLAATQNDSESRKLYEYVIKKLNSYNLAFLELMQAIAPTDNYPHLPKEVLDTYHEFYDGVLMTNGGYDYESAHKAVESGKAHLVSFARPYIANPDLAERFRQNAPLNEGNPDTYYGGGAEGYTDYPFLEKQHA